MAKFKTGDKVKVVEGTTIYMPDGGKTPGTIGTVLSVARAFIPPKNRPRKLDESGEAGEQMYRVQFEGFKGMSIVDESDLEHA